MLFSLIKNIKLQLLVSRGVNNRFCKCDTVFSITCTLPYLLFCKMKKLIYLNADCDYQRFASAFQLKLLCFKERCGSKCKQAVDLPVIVSDCMIFLSLFLAIKRMSISTVSFFAARLWNYLPLEYFLLAYGLSAWMSRVNRHLLPFSLYIIISTMCFLYLFCLILFFILKNECCT